MPALNYEQFKNQQTTAAPVDTGTSTDAPFESKPMTYEEFSNPKIRQFKLQQIEYNKAAKEATSFTSLVAKPIATGLVSPIVNAYQGVVEGYKQAAAQVQDKTFDPNEWAKTSFESWSSAITEAGNKIYDAKETVADSHKTALEKGVSIGEAGIGVLDALFSVAMTPLQVMSKIPVLGQAVDKVNELFSAIGGGASSIATKTIVQNLPISQKAKDTISPLVGEVSALTAQLITIGKGEDIIGKIADKTKQITGHLSTDIKEQAIPPETITDKIKKGVKPPEAPPTPPIAPKAEAPKGLSAKEVDTLKKEGYSDSAIAKINQTTIEQAPKIEPVGVPVVSVKEGEPVKEVPVKEPLIPVGKGEEKPSAVSERLGGSLTYQAATHEAGFKAFDEAVGGDIEKAFDIGMGKDVPKDVLPGIALGKAIDMVELGTNPDEVLDRINQLKNSPLGLSGTAAGQIAESFKEVDPDSATIRIKTIEDARRVSLEKAAKGDVKGFIGDTVAKIIKALEC